MPDRDLTPGSLARADAPILTKTFEQVLLDGELTAAADEPAPGTPAVSGLLVVVGAAGFEPATSRV